MRVTSSSGFSFRHAFYTVPSRLIGHRLHLRVHDDRIEAYLGAAHMLKLPRGRAPSKKGARTTTHIVDYRHVIGSLRAKPGALAGLTYRDALWPRTAYRRAWEALVAVRPMREAARTMVGLLALAHDFGVEADLAAALDVILDDAQLPDLEKLRTRFVPKTASAPSVHIEMPRASAYDPLIAGMRREFGVPSGVAKGRGVRSGRTIEQILELALAIRLLEAGLASSDVARLVREEWVLASSVLGFLEPEIAARGAKHNAEVFWIAEPRGLAAYQGNTENGQQRLATLVVRNGEHLSELIDGWMAGRDWTVVVIPALEVVHRLLHAYEDSGVGQLDTLRMELRSLKESKGNDLRDLVRFRAPGRLLID